MAFIGVLFRLVWLELDGFHWFSCRFYAPLPGPCFCPKGHLWWCSQILIQSHSKESQDTVLTFKGARIGTLTFKGARIGTNGHDLALVVKEGVSFSEDTHFEFA